MSRKSSKKAGRRKTQSSGAEGVERRGRSKKKPASVSSADLKNPIDSLIAATNPLLELFATVDDVFTEDDALSDEKRQMSLGRIYREWKNVRSQLDPEFKPRKKQGLPIRRMGERLPPKGKNLGGGTSV